MSKNSGAPPRPGAPAGSIEFSLTMPLDMSARSRSSGIGAGPAATSDELDVVQSTTSMLWPLPQSFCEFGLLVESRKANMPRRMLRADAQSMGFDGFSQLQKLFKSRLSCSPISRLT